MKIEDFNYHLPESSIAQEPVSPRDFSKLLVLNSKIEHKHFYNLLDYLKKGDVLVINETKVNKARIKGKKTTGTPVELMVFKTKSNQCTCRIRGKRMNIGNKLLFGKYKAEVIDEKGDYHIVKFNENVKKILKELGELPTPPYIKKKLEKDSQYQTVYSKKQGSYAAPTAGLHFTNNLLKKIKAKGIKIAKVTLHVDFGTFLPIKDIKQNKLHKEYFEINKTNAKIINNAKRLFVVGTTSTRALESVADNKGKIHPKKGSTEIFIKPGYKFKTKIHALITNFHLPKSTLIMLVSAFKGKQTILKAYKQAVKEKYRFFSFGDSMLIFK